MTARARGGQPWDRAVDVLAARILGGEPAEGAPPPDVAEFTEEFGLTLEQGYWVWRQLRKRRLLRLHPRHGLVVGPPGDGPLSGLSARKEGMVARVASDLAECIRVGRIAPHEPVGTVRELRTRYSISAEMAGFVLDRVEYHGWAYSVPGGRTFAAPPREWPAGGDGLLPHVAAGGAGAVDRHSPIPLYVQVADRVADRMRRRELRAGDPVPGEVVLSREYGISPNLARRVHRELRERGLAVRVAGRRNFAGWGSPATREAMPVYRVIACDLAWEIGQGWIAPGRVIPSPHALGRRYGVSGLTVRAAARLLVEAGWARSYGNRGIGVLPADEWPSPELWDESLSDGRDRGLEAGVGAD
ncbi:GntR family transcriptional regulator [Acrocarpospora catenulata]|uniref:GntR family transcriptional regulator n=1 Tax=Acrocarpospora catenulata TaxID=2836182 RepID=UPI001BDA7F42|nr:GntR family transcriptional regulator [Acrocarpospora catenulata]